MIKVHPAVSKEECWRGVKRSEGEGDGVWAGQGVLWYECGSGRTGSHVSALHAHVRNDCAAILKWHHRRETLEYCDGVAVRGAMSSRHTSVEWPGLEEPTGSQENAHAVSSPGACGPGTRAARSWELWGKPQEKTSVVHKHSDGKNVLTQPRRESRICGGLGAPGLWRDWEVGQLGDSERWWREGWPGV